MDAESTREFLLRLPHVAETEWFDGAYLCYWVGDKAIGGKTFAVIKLEGTVSNVLAFYAGPERFAALLEQDGIIPAPYMAHKKWVGLTGWREPAAAHLPELLQSAHSLIAEKLPKRTQTMLALPPRERKALIAERRRTLAAKARAASK